MGAIRLFLALCVVLNHYANLTLKPAGLTASPWQGAVTLGVDAGHAVFFFFIISGFLISLILDKKYAPTWAGTKAFYTSRCIRLYSLYWPLYFFSVAMFGLQPLLLGDTLSGFLLLGLDWKVAFGTYPEPYFALLPAGLNPAWSMGIEMGFYTLAPFLLRSRKAIFVTLACSILVRFALYQRFGFHSTWTYTFFPAALFFFLIGHFSYRLYANYPAYPRLNAGSQRYNWLFLPAAGMFMLAGKTSQFDNPFFYGAVLCFALALPDLFRRTKDSRLLNFLGDLSYPIYLIHLLCLMRFGASTVTVAREVLPDSVWTAPLATLLFMMFILVVAIGAHLLVERPIGRVTRTTIEFTKFYGGISYLRLARAANKH